MNSKILIVVNRDGSTGQVVVPMMCLAAVRVNAGYSQAELAEKLDVDRQTIINWEKGHTKISGEWLVMWAQVCNFPIDYIFLPIKSTKRRV